MIETSLHPGNHESIALIDALRAAFAAHADPARAAPMQAYMKSALPFYGIAGAAAPPAARSGRGARSRCATRARLADDDARAVARGALSRGALRGDGAGARRPQRAAAGDLTLLPVYEEMIVDGAWWDYCDDISGSALAAAAAARIRRR
ncbi:MAG: DNA alkylation repair protein [Comamonadaceae bacterium]|nr:DNA alkylation repair protein [Comamonadaceae bacterium]